RGTRLGQEAREAFVRETWKQREVDACLEELALEVGCVAALVRVRPRDGDAVAWVDESAECVVRCRRRAIGRVRGLLQVEVRVAAIRRRFTCSGARGVPRVHGDRRDPTTVAEVADDEDVTVLVEAAGADARAGEALAAADLVVAETDLVLKEPEPLLSVAAVVESVRAEVDQLAGWV